MQLFNSRSPARRLARQACHRQGGSYFWCRKPMLLIDRGGARDVDPRLMTADQVTFSQPAECNHARSRDANLTWSGGKFTIGDDTPVSAFADLRERLERGAAGS
jgi:hypothetical protein